MGEWSIERYLELVGMIRMRCTVAVILVSWGIVVVPHKVTEVLVYHRRVIVEALGHPLLRDGILIRMELGIDLVYLRLGFSMRNNLTI